MVKSDNRRGFGMDKNLTKTQDFSPQKIVQLKFAKAFVCVNNYNFIL